MRDSKTIADKEIRRLAKEIVAAVPNYIIRLRPAKYNELYASFKNLNSLLAWCHASVIEHLAKHTNPEVAIITSLPIHTLLRGLLPKRACVFTWSNKLVRGEADIVVAAASIVARWAFIEGLADLEKEFHLTLPKGASHSVIAAARKFVETKGVEALAGVAKLHFVTTKKIAS